MLEKLSNNMQNIGSSHAFSSLNTGKHLPRLKSHLGQETNKITVTGMGLLDTMKELATVVTETLSYSRVTFPESQPLMHPRGTRS
ncbi:hypothetical protein FF1_022846 [Malus domestica]